MLLGQSEFRFLVIGHAVDGERNGCDRAVLLNAPLLADAVHVLNCLRRVKERRHTWFVSSRALVDRAVALARFHRPLHSRQGQTLRALRAVYRAIDSVLYDRSEGRHCHTVIANFVLAVDANDVDLVAYELFSVVKAIASNFRAEPDLEDQIIRVTLWTGLLQRRIENYHIRERLSLPALE